MSQNWFSHAMRGDGGWRFQRQAVAVIGLSVFIAIIIGALYLAQASSLATLGRQLEELITRRNQLQQTNEQLRSEIAQLRSVPRLLARAQEMGFRLAQESEIEYLYVPGYNPNRQRPEVGAVVSSTTTVPPTASAPVYDESFVGWLQQQWDALVQQFQGFSGGG
jgi:cell division protein FtsB